MLDDDAKLNTSPLHDIKIIASFNLLTLHAISVH